MTFPNYSIMTDEQLKWIRKINLDKMIAHEKAVLLNRKIVREVQQEMIHRGLSIFDEA